MALVVTSSGTMATDATGSGKDYAEDCANARLMAAAPDLLEALQLARADLAREARPGLASLAAIRASISKATGEQP